MASGVKVRKTKPGTGNPSQGAEPKARKERQGPNVLAAKKLGASLAQRFFLKKDAKTTQGSDIRVGDFLFRMAAGRETPNLLAAYRRAADAVRGVDYPAGGHPFGVVGFSGQGGRPVAVVDAEFLFLLFKSIGLKAVAQLWAITGGQSGD